eukprot:1971411-Prymnesium_polylepis.1
MYGPIARNDQQYAQNGACNEQRRLASRARGHPAPWHAAHCVTDLPADPPRLCLVRAQPPQPLDQIGQVGLNRHVVHPRFEVRMVPRVCVRNAHHTRHARGRSERAECPSVRGAVCRAGGPR